mmetsp:Transcript_24167/g.26691  ORF Transcript_24167/g.26691 Transcript_24167/m.26691 type:complete len:461 (-) Transcript_24167:11-1393(-)
MTIEKLTSTTAPGKVFESRSELAKHYKSDWHRYNLKRREAGLPLLQEEEFQARLEAALALRQEREIHKERAGRNHLKDKTRKIKKSKGKSTDGVTTISQVPAYDKIINENKEQKKEELESGELAQTQTEMNSVVLDEEPPIIDPRQCLFDKHVSLTLDANIERMQRKYGFFIPDQEYLVDKEGLIGYCQEKIKIGHCCLYCQKRFSTWQGCQKHMISTRHTKLRYERGIDQDEYDPFYDFSEADAEFLDTTESELISEENVIGDEVVDSEWEDVTDDEGEAESEDNDVMDCDEEGGVYDAYKDEIARFGLDVTPLGELVFPDGRIVGHRGLARYYKQRIFPSNERAAVVAARRAAGERLYQGQVYSTSGTDDHQSSLALFRGDTTIASVSGRSGKGVLVPSAGGQYTALSLYRYKAVVKKARRDDARGQRLEYRASRNPNKTDKKANRIMNGVSVAHAAR